MSADQDYMTSNDHLQQSLQNTSAFEVLGHFCGIPAVGSPQRLNEAAVVCIDAEWWQKEPKPTTELGIAELMQKGLKELQMLKVREGYRRRVSSHCRSCSG